MDNILIKARVQGDTVKFAIKIKHDIIKYDIKKKKSINSNFITMIVGFLGSSPIFEVNISQCLSKDQLFKFEIPIDFIKEHKEMNDILMKLDPSLNETVEEFSINCIDMLGNKFDKSVKIRNLKF